MQTSVFLLVPLQLTLVSSNFLFYQLGFTAWSSVREPTQVFHLLENLYQNFDKIAKRRRIFKVETVSV